MVFLKWTVARRQRSSTSQGLYSLAICFLSLSSSCSSRIETLRLVDKEVATFSECDTTPLLYLIHGAKVESTQNIVKAMRSLIKEETSHRSAYVPLRYSTFSLYALVQKWNESSKIPCKTWRNRKRPLKVKQAGNGPSRSPAQGSKSKSFSNLKKNTIAEVLSILQCQKIPERICLRLGNYFSPQLEVEKTHLAHWEKMLGSFQKMSPKYRIMPKTLRNPLCSQNFWFRVKNGGGVDKNK